MNSFLKPLYFLAISAFIANAQECEKISISIKNFDEYLGSSDFILPKLKNLQERTICLEDNTTIQYYRDGESYYEEIYNPNNIFFMVSRSYENNRFIGSSSKIVDFPLLWEINYKSKISPIKIMESFAKLGEVDLKTGKIRQGEKRLSLWYKNIDSINEQIKAKIPKDSNGVWTIEVLPYFGQSSQTDIFYFNDFDGSFIYKDKIFHKIHPISAHSGQVIKENYFNYSKKGIAYDKRTKFSWQDKPCDLELNWQEAKVYCENLDYAGYKNWKLPNRHELATLAGTHYDKYYGSYWSSSQIPFVDFVAYAQNLSPMSDDSGYQDRSNKENELKVLCVRRD
jgi:hypothetical protein